MMNKSLRTRTRVSSRNPNYGFQRPPQNMSERCRNFREIGYVMEKAQKKSRRCRRL
jgi:hypothetical protein